MAATRLKDASTAATRGPDEIWPAFLAAHPDTREVDLVLPDLSGIGRGKRMEVRAFAGGLDAGFCFPTTLYALDSTGANVDRTGLVWEEGDADRPCFADLATLRTVPWRPGGAQVLGGMCEEDGRPFFADPRAVLQGVADRLAELGLTPCAALELEFYLVQPGLDADGTPRPPIDPGTGAPGADVQVYSMERLDAQDTFLTELRAFAEAQGLPVKDTLAEYAPGQYEVNLGHVADPLRAADDAFLFKRTVKAAARRAGLLATFMAKPFTEQSGSGLHIHLSLLDREGRNIFAGADGEARLLHAIGGLRAALPESMLLFAPNANSFRRFRPGSYAPMAPTWGHNNRTVALRVPRSGPGARRVEHRVAGADANPYLALAAVLAGVHHGLTDQLDPGPAVTGNAYIKVPPSLPRSWDRAIDAFGRGRILPDYLGADFCRVYRLCREAERERFHDVIQPVEYAWYLRHV
jgi:glutamine synthetase